MMNYQEDHCSDKSTLSERSSPLPLTISIVTPTYCQAHYIEQTIRSVVEQDYPHIDYIVMDAGSTDGTIDILKHYQDRLRWHSEPDNGQADAINRGFALATGEILGWLNSDDYYAPGALRRVAQFFAEHPEAAFVYGDAINIGRKGRKYGKRLHVEQRQTLQESDFDVLLHRYDFLVQPACFWRVSLWREIGELDSSLHYVMDYDYWLRVARRVKLHYLPVPLAYERLYGAAKTSTGGLSRIEEIRQMAQRYGGQGLPRNYWAEEAAYHTISGLRSLLTGQFATARSHFRQGWPPRYHRQTYFRFLIVLLLLGPRGIPIAWLWLSRVRNQWRSEPPLPSGDGSASR